MDFEALAKTGNTKRENFERGITYYEKADFGF